MLLTALSQFHSHFFPCKTWKRFTHTLAKEMGATGSARKAEIECGCCPPVCPWQYTTPETRHSEWQSAQACNYVPCGSTFRRTGKTKIPVRPAAGGGPTTRTNKHLRTGTRCQMTMTGTQVTAGSHPRLCLVWGLAARGWHTKLSSALNRPEDGHREKRGGLGHYCVLRETKCPVVSRYPLPSNYHPKGDSWFCLAEQVQTHQRHNHLSRTDRLPEQETDRHTLNVLFPMTDVGSRCSGSLSRHV